MEDHFGNGKAMRMVGEVAHIAGESPDGPRGSSGVPVPDRNEAENLMLLCPTDHTDADSGRLVDPLYTEDYLRQLKAQKEAWIRFVTGLTPDRTTTVLRLSGDVRGRTCLVDKNEAAAATMNDALRVPQYMPDASGIGLLINIAEIPEPGSATYWQTCLRQVDNQLERVHNAAKSNDELHLSVFAFALLPILMALGNQLDDTIPVDIYNRHKARQTWRWDTAAPVVQFDYQLPQTTSADEAVMIVNGSGTINNIDIPEHLSHLPIITLQPANGAAADNDTFSAERSLAEFSLTVRKLLSELEIRHKTIKRIHLFAALPVAPAVEIGRVWPIDNAAPAITVYHRTNDEYIEAITLPRITENN